MYKVEGKTEEDIKWILDIFIFSGVILVNLQLKFQHFQPSELEKCTKIGRDASYFPHTKLLQPCMGLKGKQKRISGEKLTFSFFQGVVFLSEKERKGFSTLRPYKKFSPTFWKGWPTVFLLKFDVLWDEIIKFQFAKMTTGPQWFPLTITKITKNTMWSTTL